MYRYQVLLFKIGDDRYYPRKANFIFLVVSAFKMLTGRPRRKWEDNVRIYIKEIGVDVMS